jgi:hypothetical protein
MKNSYPKFLSKSHLTELIDAYFEYVENYQPAKRTGRSKVSDLLKEENGNKEVHGPATISGLAYYLGFDSRDQFESYESSGRFAVCIKRARLRIEEAYEKKLQQQSSGIIFALKTFGWNEKSEKKGVGTISKTMRVEVVETGPKPADNEKGVNI